jgi:hypothetical protein
MAEEAEFLEDGESFTSSCSSISECLDEDDELVVRESYKGRICGYLFEPTPAQIPRSVSEGTAEELETEDTEDDSLTAAASRLSLEVNDW